MTEVTTLLSFLHPFPSGSHQAPANWEHEVCWETPLVRMLRQETEGPQGCRSVASAVLCCHWWRNGPTREDAERLAFWELGVEPEKRNFQQFISAAIILRHDARYSEIRA